MGYIEYRHHGRGDRLMYTEEDREYFRERRRLREELRKLNRKHRGIKSRNGLEKHHRRSRDDGGEDTSRNISFISGELHDAWHRLFGTGRPNDVCAILNSIYIDPDIMVFQVPRTGADPLFIMRLLNAQMANSPLEVYLRQTSLHHRKHRRKSKQDKQHKDKE